MITGKRPLIIFLILTIGGLISFSDVAQAQKALYLHRYPEQGDTRIAITSPFTKGPSHGFRAIRIAVKNDTEQDREWSFIFENSSVTKTNSTFRFEVEAGQEISRDILVPVPWHLKYSTYRQERIRVQADGLPPLSNYNSEQFQNDWPNIIISGKLAARNLTLLSNYRKEQFLKGKKKTHRASSSMPFASTFDIKNLPTDWQAYIGYDAMMITSDEWKQLRPAVQNAILESIRFGGILQIFTESTDRASQFLSLGFDRIPVLGNIIVAQHSYGSIELHGWNGKDIKLTQTYNKLSNAKRRRIDYENTYTNHWGLQTAFGTKNFNPLLVMLILTIFSVVVGPVNLFSLAKTGRRHRLFFTTPIISIVASLLVIGIILAKDGLGGKGRRMLVMDLEGAADEKRAYITQEQISRTGVLLGNSFQNNDSSFFTQIQLAKSQWSHTINRSRQLLFAYQDHQFSGDWFKSRTEQGQVIQSVRPTRSRIEVVSHATNTEAPRLFSSLEFTVDQLFYVGNGGRVWKATKSPIPPGSEIILEPSTRNALGTEWWIPLTDALSSGYDTKVGDYSFRRKTRDISHQPGHFFAVSKDPKVGYIETLDSIKWTNANALIFGPAVDSPSTKTSTDQDPAAK